jgi:hypothetical protein
MELQHCYSFENRRKHFEIDSRFKFAVVVAIAEGITDRFWCAYYLHDDEWLFGERERREPLHYSLDFVRATGGPYLSLVELRRDSDRLVAELMYSKSRRASEVLKEREIRLQGPPAVLHMSHESNRFVAATETGDALLDPRQRSRELTECEQHFLLMEGKNFWHYDDLWSEPPRYWVPLSEMTDKPELARRARYYQLAFRAIAASTNERTAVAALIPPGALFGHSCFICSTTGLYGPRLELLAVFNCFPYDWSIRQFVGSNVSLFIIGGTPYPIVSRVQPLLVHSALRLTCNHSGYEPLWREQVGDAWREEGKEPFTWPVLAGDDERWEVRAAIDAVVADAYGLSRDQYEHVLSTFSHKSYPKAPQLCLAKFDESKKLGLEAFTRKHDPYHDIPLDENLPQPVIDLPIPEETRESEQGKLF